MSRDLDADVFSLLGDNVPVLMYYSDRDLCYRYANAYFGVVHDIDPDTILGSHIREVIGGEGFAEALPYYEQVLSGEKVSYEAFFLTKSGRPHHYRATYIPHHVGDLVEGFAALIVDITDIKNSNEIKEEVFQLLSHDMRAPLASALAILELALRDSLDFKTEILAKKIQACIDKSLKYINDYLRLSAADSQPKNKWKVINFEQVLQDALLTFQPVAKLKRVRFHCAAGMLEAVFIKANQSMLERAVANLLDNAIKFSAENTGLVTLSVRLESGFLYFSVMDNGIGIEGEDINRLLASFSRGKGASDYPGYGLGLRYTAMVCEQHGGRLEAASNADQGACFTMVLPGLI
jgi:signal transduction histidine kinase